MWNESKLAKPRFRTGAPIMKNVESEIVVTATASLQKEIEKELTITSKKEDDETSIAKLLEKSVREYTDVKVSESINKLISDAGLPVTPVVKKKTETVKTEIAKATYKLPEHIEVAEKHLDTLVDEILENEKDEDK